MNIEEQIKIVKNMLLHSETQLLDYEAIAIETILTAYEKEKEKREKLEYEALEAKEYIKRLKECHLQYEEMTGIDLLLPSKEE